MSAVVDAMAQLLNIPEVLERMVSSEYRAPDGGESRGVGSIPADILDTPKEYVFYLDVPGLSKSDIQVGVEDERTLVIKSNGKRKREEEECKYLRLERKAAPQKVARKFRLPENCNVSAITAKCENGVLTVVVEKHPPPPKSKTIEVPIS
ncbi:PREDICTED: 17.4 kDa class III heat shock protein [Ipomoea nil]|uniref:17.4 kDa class III heat shock protein n=1 Tax=Ipomoea nil TaxID=35883 RepID=UPI00090170B4|nr:PREDICTED: 17.4 kDa class III heat shock protein [Ipomoea nil]XP_019198343.1 PREDICTED: 17.4 kDa class III heat shock protein [Ipomoea nil]